MTYTFPSLDQLIRDDRDKGEFLVHRSAMTSQVVFDEEQQRIFDHCWLYVGHESEVDQEGAYLRRTVAGRPLIFVRDTQAKVRVFLNSCTHRGAMVAREDSGVTRAFQCFYHAWTFNTKGELIAVPDEPGYGPCFDRTERDLHSPARVDSYRGFYFVSFDPDAQELSDYLAGAKEYLDLIVDQSEVGMTVVPGANKYGTKANWKLVLENSIEGYHAAPLHVTYLEYLHTIGGGLKRNALNTGRGRDLGNGHAVLEMEAPWARPIAHWEPLFGEEAREDIAGIRRRLVERFGEERAYKMAETFRLLLIFPNLIVNDIAAITIRVIEPISPGYHETTAWALAPRDEQGDRLRRRLDSFLSFIGPGGLATPDDVEALESCQQGFRAVSELEWSDISRGMTRESGSLDELQIRTFWRMWFSMVSGAAKPAQVAGVEVEART